MDFPVTIENVNDRPCVHAVRFRELVGGVAEIRPIDGAVRLEFAEFLLGVIVHADDRERAVFESLGHA